MGVSAGQLILRGLLHLCPNCGRSSIIRFPWRTRKNCQVCGLVYEREDGFFLGALVFNYTFTAVVILFPVLILVFMEKIDLVTALIIAVVGSVVFPFLFFPTSKSLWMMTYYLFVRKDLPASNPPPPLDDEPTVLHRR